MTSSTPAAFEKYWDLRVQSMSARLEAALEIIHHNPTRGTLAENLLRDLLSEFLPQRWGVGSGFVVDPAGQCSRQIDILIYDLFGRTPIYRDGSLVVATTRMARVALEIKSQLDADSIPEALTNIASVKMLDPAACGIIFGYQGPLAPTLSRHLNNPPADGPATGSRSLADRVYVLDRNIVALRKLDQPAAPEEAAVLMYDLHKPRHPVVRSLLLQVLSALNLTNLQSYVGGEDLGEPLADGNEA